MSVERILDNLIDDSSDVVSQLMGEAYLNQSEIKILSSRNISALGGRGLTSNEILTYLFIKLHSHNGFVKYFRTGELVEYAGISRRDVYYVLNSLKKAGLIYIKGRERSIYKDIGIYHKGTGGKKFLSLNRSFFVPVGRGEEIKEFRKLSAGAKSCFIYLLGQEKFYKDESGNVGPKTKGNSIAVTFDQIVKDLHVKKDTAIRYIKEINEKIYAEDTDQHKTDFFKIKKAIYGNIKDERVALLQDKRTIYGAVTSDAKQRWDTTTENKASGFWRMFNMWLDCHGLSWKGKFSLDEEKCVVVYRGSREDTIKEDLFSNFIMLLKQGISWNRISQVTAYLIKKADGMHTLIPSAMYKVISNDIVLT